MKKLLPFMLLTFTISCYGSAHDKVLKFILQDNNEYAVEACFLRSLFDTNEVAIVYKRRSSASSAKAFVHPQASQEFVTMVQNYLINNDKNCNYRVIQTKKPIKSLLQ